MNILADRQALWRKHRALPPSGPEPELEPKPEHEPEPELEPELEPEPKPEPEPEPEPERAVVDTAELERWRSSFEECDADGDGAWPLGSPALMRPGNMPLPPHAMCDAFGVIGTALSKKIGIFQSSSLKTVPMSAVSFVCLQGTCPARRRGITPESWRRRIRGTTSCARLRTPRQRHGHVPRLYLAY